MDISPIRVPGIGAVWQINTGLRSDLIRTAKVASTMYKQSGYLSKEWTKRFCILKPMNMLFYFDGDGDQEPKGIIALDEQTQIELLGEFEGRNHVLVIKTPHSRDSSTIHRLILAAETESEAKEWNNALYQNRISVITAERDDLKRRLEISQIEALALSATIKEAREGMVQHDNLIEKLHREQDIEANAIIAATEYLLKLLEKLKDTTTELRTITNKTSSSSSLPSISNTPYGSSSAAIGNPSTTIATSNGTPLPTLQSLSGKVPDTVLSLAPNVVCMSTLATGLGATEIAIIDIVASCSAIQTAYRTLSAKAKEVAKMVQKLNTQLSIEQEHQKAQEEVWSEKEKQWANAVQKLAEKLQKERDKTKVLADMVRTQIKNHPSNSKTNNAGYPTGSTDAGDPVDITNNGSNNNNNEAVGNENMVSETRSRASSSIGGITSTTAKLMDVSGIFDTNSSTNNPNANSNSNLNTSTDVHSALQADLAKVLSDLEAHYDTTDTSSTSQANPVQSTSIAFNPPPVQTPTNTTPTVTNDANVSTGKNLLHTFSRGLNSATDVINRNVASGIRTAATAAFTTTSGVLTPGGTQILDSFGNVIGSATTQNPGLDIMAHESTLPRLYVFLMAGRNLPSDFFVGFGAKNAYVKVTGFELTEKVSRPVDVTDKGKGRGLCAIFHTVIPIKINGFLHSGKLRLDVMSHRIMKKDVHAGSALLDVSSLLDWPTQPHAAWVMLTTDENKPLVASPAEIPVPVTGTVIYHPDAPHAAAPLPPGSLTTTHPALAPLTLAPPEKVDGEHWALKDMPPAPVDAHSYLLLQLCYCPRLEDKPRFFAPPSEPPPEVIGVVPSLPVTNVATANPMAASMGATTVVSSVVPNSAMNTNKLPSTDHASHINPFNTPNKSIDDRAVNPFNTGPSSTTNNKSTSVGSTPPNVPVSTVVLPSTTGVKQPPIAPSLAKEDHHNPFGTSLEKKSTVDTLSAAVPSVSSSSSTAAVSTVGKTKDDVSFNKNSSNESNEATISVPASERNTILSSDNDSNQVPSSTPPISLQKQLTVLKKAFIALREDKTNLANNLARLEADNKQLTNERAQDKVAWETAKAEWEKEKEGLLNRIKELETLGEKV